MFQTRRKVRNRFPRRSRSLKEGGGGWFMVPDHFRSKEGLLRTYNCPFDLELIKCIQTTKENKEEMQLRTVAQDYWG